MRMLRIHRDERGSLPLAMLAITLGMALSATLVPLVVRQITVSRDLSDRDAALNAAQSGLEVVMARVRAASDISQNGLLEDLPPCSLSGDAGSGTGESLPYAVTIKYYDQDGNQLGCPTYTVPTTASVKSVGRGVNVTRTLTATYVFTTSNTNIPGGGIKIAASTASSTGTLCMDAGAVRPALGAAITMQVCNGSSKQQFGYTSDLYLKLVNTESSATPYGECLDAGATHSSGNTLVFAACPATRTARYQWSLDGSSQYHSTSAASAIESLCVNVKTANLIGSPVVLGSCPVNNSLDVWRSDTGVGAGMAGDSTNQLVNYAQFSRCLDVTSQSTTATYMIAWFCKQSPNGVVDWNQQWVHPTPVVPAVSATGNIVVTKSGATYCLKSPLSSAATVYAVVTACTPPVTTAALVWTVYHDTGDYTTSYRIMDSSGYCLTPTDLTVANPDTHSDGTSKVKVAVCSGNELQKWNAPPNINKPDPLNNLTEQ